ncbi:hypothetical protein O7602_24420 [Micromonospora sp. WMMD1128]|uniref:hypothetical protein n=1 Tax=Micromonospora sp. WMMD1128 TaxID=3015150 RepID=UPI00248B8994|nr:hypothetical protein [Micromonospora sp. WMMD1128]WBB72813.1 hypothetical protein O7602_24420 [Micromonospora sp. WMMD1128]
MTRPEPAASDGARIALAWLGQPVTVLALVVLVLNDHVLKAARPGPVTGKLSDVAGLVLAPPLVAALVTLVVPRLRVGVAAAVALGSVGVGFALVKTSGYAATTASQLWTAVSGPSLVRADRTDLLALPALAVAAWAWRRARRDPVGRRATRLVRLLVLLPAATLAVAATSAVWYPDAIDATVVDGRLAAGIGESLGSDPSGRLPNWRMSDDAGVTWRDPTAAEKALLPSRPEDLAQPARQACSVAAPRLCYRLVPGRIRVETSDDAGRTWRLSWQVTEEQRELLKARYAEPGPRGERIAGQDLAVLDADGGGHVVLVANGRDGFAVRGTDGKWRRIGFTDDRWGRSPPSLDAISPSERHDDPLRAVMLTFTLAVLVLVVSGMRAGHAAGFGWSLPIALLSLLFLVAMTMIPIWLSDDLVVPVAALTCAVLLVGGTSLALAPNWARGAPGRWIVEVLLAAVLTLVLAGLPLTGWLYGRPVYAWTAVALAGLAVVPGLLLGWRAARLVEPWRPPVAPPWPPPYLPYPPDPPYPRSAPGVGPSG